jgi:hypothetical protein
MIMQGYINKTVKIALSTTLEKTGRNFKTRYTEHMRDTEKIGIT